MPDVAYTFHVPHPDEGRHGVLLVEPDTDSVTVQTFNQEGVLIHDTVLDVLEWEETVRQSGAVITPLIRRLGAAVLVRREDNSQAIGVLIPHAEGSRALLCAESRTYRALISKELDVAELFFLDVLKTALISVGEVLYLNMQASLLAWLTSLFMSDLYGWTGLGRRAIQSPGRREQGPVHSTQRPTRQEPRDRQAVRDLPAPTTLVARQVHQERNRHHARRASMGRSIGIHVPGPARQCGQASAMMPY
jgi:hypothetical protein